MKKLLAGGAIILSSILGAKAPTVDAGFYGCYTEFKFSQPQGAVGRCSSWDGTGANQYRVNAQCQTSDGTWHYHYGTWTTAAWPSGATCNTGHGDTYVVGKVMQFRKV